MQGIFQFSMPHPHKDIAYAVYTLQTPTSLHLGAELFTNQFRCSLSLFISSIHNTIKEMILRGHALKSFPVISLFEHISSQLSRSVPYTVLARVFRAEALIQLNLFADAIQCVKGLIIGADLPILCNNYHTAPDGGLGGSGFNDQLPLNHPKNIKVLSILTDKPLSLSLKKLYGSEPTSALLLAKSRLLVKLASTCPDIMSHDLFMSRYHDNRSSSLTSIPSQGSLSKSMSVSMSWSKLRSGQEGEIPIKSVKMALLEHSMKTLTEVLGNTGTHVMYIYMYTVIWGFFHSK